MLQRSEQRVLNDLQITRLSRHRTISPTPFPSPVSKLSLFLSLPLCRLSSLRMGEGVGEEPNHTTAKKPGPL